MTVKVIAYRGEHGARSESKFQSRLGSLSFGSIEAAKTYATQPNHYHERPVDPRVYKAHITIENPIFNNPNDPFVDLDILRKAIGDEKTLQIARDLEDHLLNTNNFLELLEDHDCMTLDDLHKKLGSDVLDLLYVDAYPVMDSETYVGWFKELGYDGAVHGGNGATALEAEYKIFDPSQAQIIKEYDLSPKRQAAVEPSL